VSVARKPTSGDTEKSRAVDVPVLSICHSRHVRADRSTLRTQWVQGQEAAFIRSTADCWRAASVVSTGPAQWRP
jgi:hypothetical protein